MTGRKTTQETIDKVVALRKSGMSAGDVFKRLGIPSSTASAIWTKYLYESKLQSMNASTNDEPESPGIDWQAKWCEAQQQIAELKEINSILKGYVRHLQRLTEQQDRM